MCEVVGLIKLTVTDCSVYSRPRSTGNFDFGLKPVVTTLPRPGSCTVNATNPSTGECNTSICPSGCAPCDETDECHRYFFFTFFFNQNFSFLRKYHETECGMLSPAIRLEPNVPDFQFCLAICAGTYLIFVTNATNIFV